MSISESPIFEEDGGFGHVMELAKDLIRLLERRGYETWIVGGSIRDALLGRPISDIDLATSAHWSEVKYVCEAEGHRVRESGTKHGTVTVIIEDGDGSYAYEVTTFRADSPTSADSRHPDSVEFVSSIEEDLARRDITINAMAWHPDRGLFDPYDGSTDIEKGVLRAVGDPSKRFKEDALRILRICRFASQLGFTIDERTYSFMLSDKSLLIRVSKERATHELDLLLMGDHVHDAIMGTVDVLAVVLPELVAMKDCPQVTKYHVYDVLEHTAWALQRAVKDRKVRWAVLCHDMGKPACAFFDGDGVEHFYGHAHVSATIARGLLARFMLSKQFREDVVKLILVHSDHGAASEKAVRRFLSKLDGREDLFRTMLEVNIADILAHAPEYRSEVAHIEDLERMLEKVLEKDATFTVRDLAIDGKDVIGLGVEPGPGVGSILGSCLDEVIEGNIANERDALLDLVSRKMSAIR